MTSSRSAVRGVGGATPDDIARLWHTLVDEYIPGLRVEIIPKHDPKSSAHVLVQVVDYNTVPHPSMLERNIWAEREFHSPLYLISHNQLFDLLIVAHRVIDEYFATGNDNRPRPVVA